MAYSGSASILYLIYSLSWKWNEVLRKGALLHSLALVFAVFSILHRPVSLYILIFIFWVLNLFLSFGVIPFDLRSILYTLSVVVLMIIAYRVLRKT
ncbi:MAG: hypothetical protein NZ879_08195 [Archaeoglobaceae archaeon]|nr:hypothetical protein [Archaeoglobaceae archaeon]MDW8118945.1 hypothetical protein [Archaeoglobaceae archaeon]